jgi:hypothetical protein
MVFVVVFLVGQLAVGLRATTTASITGDEPFYLLTTQSLLSDGNLDLRDEYSDRSEMDRFWDGLVPLWKQMEPTPDGRLLSPHDPGLSILLLPAYAVGGGEGSQRFLVAVWAAAMAIAAVAASRLGAPRPAAGVAAIAVGAGLPGAVYASEVYPEGPAALCIAVVLLLLTSERARPLVLSGTLVALAWLGVKYIPFAVLLAAVWGWRWRREPQALLAVSVVGLVAGAHYLWWHQHTFDGLTPYSTNVVYAGEVTTKIVQEHLSIEDRSYRLYGLFLDARFGLLRWLPLMAIALWGITKKTATHLATLAIAVLMGTFVSITMMGWWFPGRMLVAALPALAVLIAVGIPRLPKTSAALALYSLAITAGLIASRPRIAVEPWIMGVPLPPHWLFPDFREFGVPEIAASAAWVLALVGARWRSAAPSTSERVVLGSGRRGGAQP